jgi:hypothetical protein
VPASARGEHTATLVGEGLIFIVGGMNGRKKLSDVHAFNTGTFNLAAMMCYSGGLANVY